jgi:hypothetical protein
MTRHRAGRNCRRRPRFGRIGTAGRSYASVLTAQPGSGDIHGGEGSCGFRQVYCPSA